MFPVEQSWKMSETQKVLEIVQELRIWRLGDLDGCCCCSFQIRNFSIETYCGKGLLSRGVKVSSRAFGFTKEDLLPVAVEVQKQLEECDGRGAAPITIDVGG
jgi:hypothetical protein